MAATTAEVSQAQIPGGAVAADGPDVAAPTRALLESIGILANKTDTDAAGNLGTFFFGAPQSVALIEATATAAAKWWAAGLGVIVTGMWGAVAAWWPSQHESAQVATVAGGALVTAAFVIAAGYLIASDVRGRAAASVAAIEARGVVARTMVEAAQAAYVPAATDTTAQIAPLPNRLNANYTKRSGQAGQGWLVVAIERAPDGTKKYVIVKGSEEQTVPAGDLEFLPA